MKKYSSYKDSGVKWLGQIPSHWEVKHLRNFLTLFSEKGYEDCQLLSVTREKGVILRDKDNKEENHNFVPDDLSGYKHLNAGDFVINKMKSWQGSYGVSDYEGIVSPAYFTCKLHGVKPSFFSRAIRSKAYIGFFMQYSKGIRVDQWDLDPNSMKDIPFILPPIAEQDAIVTYLDTATAKIDAAILQQQKMIDLLKERKQIIINSAVTRGLDKNVKMKDSGVEWIGEIPEHWEVRRLKYLMQQITAPSNSSNKIGLENIESGTGQFINTNSEYEGNGIQFEKGDILYGKLRPYLKKVYIADISGNAVGDFFVFRPKTEMYGKYIQYLLLSQTLTDIINSSTYGAKMPRVSINFMECLYIAFPPFNEQQEIVDYIENISEPIDRAITNCDRQIALLQERKQIIINDVVTGKVKVE